MASHIKMIVYGEPGVGKSTFAKDAPKPFFITTDENYEYLVDYFGCKEADHKQVYTWAEAKKTFQQSFDGYETVVVDLLEDLYIWADSEFCKSNNIDHISDLGYGKGYGILGDDFFMTISKLLSIDKNVILLMHGTTVSTKDRRGLEVFTYSPSSLVREKIITQIEGRVRFFLRAFAETAEDGDGNLVTNRYLSLSPDGKTEYGIARGLVGNVPRNIPLDWNTFYEIASRKPTNFGTTSTVKIEEKAPKAVSKPAPAPVKKPNTAEETAELFKKAAENIAKVDEEEEVVEDKSTTSLKDKLKQVAEKLQATEVAKPTKVTQAEVTPVPTQEVTGNDKADRLAAIKARLAAQRNK